MIDLNVIRFAALFYFIIGILSCLIFAFVVLMAKLSIKFNPEYNQTKESILNEKKSN